LFRSPLVESIPFVVIETGRSLVTLRRLRPSDAVGYASLLRENREHLTRLGNYEDEVATPATEYAEQFGRDGPALAFGIYEAETMVGSVALVAVDPPRYGLGYWLAEGACGRGLATLAVAAVVTYASDVLSATDVYAGVTHGNEKSIAVLTRNGFSLSAEFEAYDRYHCALAGEGAGVRT
jgi:RimJ/RimL family protein N-acetyltransferase